MSDLLSSWSRRRAAVAAEAEKEDVAAREATLAHEEDALADKSDAEILETLGLPNPDSLAMGDDFKAFMSKAVPAHLRKRALRKLWRSNPVLACVDGLNDYDDDYLAQSLGHGAFKTSYQVGKGMLAHLLEVERLKEAGPQDATTVVADHDEMPEPDPVAADDRAASPPEIAETEEPAPLAPRRMHFQFEDDTV